METRNCTVCGRAFIPLSANGKYCSGTCADRGQAIRRREWENRTGYREKRRIQAQERRDAIKAAAEADREAAAQQKAEEQARRRSEPQEQETAGSLGRLRQAGRAGGNITPEYWEAFKEYDLEFAAESGQISRTEVNGIPVQAADFGRLVCDSIIGGSPIITRVKHERKPTK